MSIWLLLSVPYVCGCPAALPITITSAVWSPDQPSPDWGASATISGYTRSEAWVNVNSCQIEVSTQAGIVSTDSFPCFYGLEQLGREVKIRTGVWRLPKETLEGLHQAEIRLIGDNDEVMGCFQAPITVRNAPSSQGCEVYRGLTFSHLTWLSTASAYPCFSKATTTLRETGTFSPVYSRNSPISLRCGNCPTRQSLPSAE